MARALLVDVLAHNDADVVDRFLDEFHIPLGDAVEIFEETRRWVWLCAEAREDRKDGIVVGPLYIDRPIHFIDEGWHNWILHTKRYREFCETHFGFFVDHVPTPKRIKDVKKVQLESSAAALDSTLSSRQRQYEYIYEKLGADTLERWYSTLCKKYWSLSDHRRQ